MASSGSSKEAGNEEEITLLTSGAVPGSSLAILEDHERPVSSFSLEQASTSARMPGQIWFIIGNEACERFSFYGMRCILVVFMIDRLAFTASRAETVYHLFIAGCYIMPLAGAYISDYVLGKYRTILYISLVYCAGHLLLALWDGRVGLCAGLGLIAIGTGGIKPCVSAFVGDQFSEASKHLLPGVFALFYWSINFGSFFATMTIPAVLAGVGPTAAFGLPGIFMMLATLLFWSGRRSYVNVPPRGADGRAGVCRVTWCTLVDNVRQQGLCALMRPGFWEAGRARFGDADVEAASAIVAVAALLPTVAVFWALFDQHSSTWVVQAQQMDLSVLGWRLQPAQLQSMNPVLVMALIPTFRYFLFPAAAALGLRLTPLRKMAAGMALTGLSFVIVGLLQVALDAGARVSALWQAPAFLVLTMSEILVSVTGLEFSYSQVPSTHKSTMMSLWLLTTAAGNLLDAYVAKINVFHGAALFFFFAGLMFGVSIVFIVMASRYQMREFVGAAETESAAKQKLSDEEG